jgi:hypothetical protein
MITKLMITKVIAGLLATLAMSTANARLDSARPDEVLEWNEIMVTHMMELPPTTHTRLGAMMHLAVFEAVQAASGAPAQAATRAATITAAHRILRANLPAKAAELDAAREVSLARISNGRGKREGIDLGEAAAAAMIAARTGDGSDLEEFHVPDSVDPGVWQPTPACPPAGGVFLHWRNVRPFALRRAEQFRSAPPPALGSHRYAKSYMEVMKVGGRDSTARPPDRADVARMYAVVGDGILWNPVARQLASVGRHSLVQNARTFALLNMALADAAIAVTETKYYYDFWRPETAIVAAGADGNDRTDPLPSFTPLIPTPCFPGYPSGHAVLSHAARKVLERVFGSGGHAIVVASPELPGVVLRYSRLEDLTTDVDDARVFGGIHFRFDQTAGAEQGRKVGAYVWKHGLGAEAKQQGARPALSESAARQAGSAARPAAPPEATAVPLVSRSHRSDIRRGP